MNEDSDTYGMNRRTMMTLTGGLGVLGMMSGVATADGERSEGNAAAETKQIVGEEDWMYQCIQEAHDDLPPEGGHIYVTEGYESSQESFPIVLTKHARVEGANKGSTTVDASGSGADVFRITEADQEYSRTSAIENLRIIGGRSGVVISPDTHVYLGHLFLWEQAKHGVVTTKPNDNPYGSFMTYLEDVNVGRGGGNGFDLQFKGVPHATVMNRCSALRMDGNGGKLTGSATQVTGGAYQYNDKNGLRIKDAQALTVRDCYFEKNGQDGDGPPEYADIYAHAFRPLLPISSFDNEMLGTNSLVIEGNYFNNLSGADRDSDVGIFLEEAHGTQIQGNAWTRFNSDGEGFIHIDETCTDVDVHRASNQTSNYSNSTAETFIQNDDGYRTRSDGLIQPTDLSMVEGLHEGDKGIHFDPKNKAKSDRVYVWRDGAWHSGQHTVEFSGDHGYDSGASVTFEPGEWNGETIAVDEATLPDGGFLSLLDLQGRPLGHSAYLSPGTHSDVEIEVSEDGSRGITPNRRHPTHWLAAVAHRDSNGNERFDWKPGTARQVDEPYLEWAEGGPQWVYDGGQSTVVE